MMIIECAVIGPFATERGAVGPYTALVFEAPLPSTEWNAIVVDGTRYETIPVMDAGNDILAIAGEHDLTEKTRRSSDVTHIDYVLLSVRGIRFKLLFPCLQMYSAKKKSSPSLIGARLLLKLRASESQDTPHIGARRHSMSTSFVLKFRLLRFWESNCHR